MNFSWVIPGKLAGSMGPTCEEDLEYLKNKGVGAIVRMEQRTVSGDAAGLVDMAEFVPDMYPPTFSQIDRMIDFIKDRITSDVPVAVSCRAGMGRTGTVLACYLVCVEGYSAGDAIRHLRALRPGSVESPPQREFVYEYEERLKSSGPGSRRDPSPAA